MAKKITEVGPKALRGIRNPDLYKQDPLYLAAMLKYRDSYAAFKGLSGQRYTSEPTSYSEETIPYDDPRSTGYSGVRSTFDLPLYIGGVDEQTIQDTRANNQPWYAQLGAGIAKGVLTAGTTFLDGTVGLLVGAGSAIANGSWGKLFNNDFSQAMRLFTQEMEKELPNYRTTDEEDNPMAWRNLLTMNTFADDFLKNLGFTVGAFYSGNAFLGALKAVKLGSLISKTAAQTIGSVVSGFNEGRIEAGNLYDETVKEETQKLTEANQRAYDEIQQLIDAIELTPDLLVRTSDGSYYSPKQLQLMELRQQLADLARSYDKQVKGILDRAEKAAVADMALNTLYLPLTDMYAYGKLYSRGFKVKKDLAGKVTKGIAETAEEGGEKAVKKEIKEKAIDVAAKQEAEKQALGDRIKKGAKEYITDPVTRKKATIRGLKTGLSEGAEEINQSMFSSYSGALYSPDSPDAYYQALTNEDYQIKTKDQLTAMTLAMMDSWGNPSTYKEGLIGFMTGILGMPTFGRVSNSDENTYLGKNKAIGLSGGLFGEISRANRLNREAEVAASAMNKLVKKADDIERFFVRSQAFTDPMEGYSKEGNKFEFENASDNDLFNAIDAFARTGRLNDLRELVGESFGDIDNLSVEDLKDIAEKTKGDTNEWNNPDGTSMADKPETRPKMQKLLKEKQQKILNAIDSYEDSLEKVRTISNNSLDTDLVAELAWLDWKIKQFENRYKDIKSNNDELFKAMSNALLDYRDELTPDPGYESDMTDDEIDESISKLLKQLENTSLTKEEREDINDLIESLKLTRAAKVELSNTNNLIKFISALQKAKNPSELSAVIESNPTIVDYLLGKGRGLNPKEAYDSFDGKLGISFDLYKKAMDELADTAKLSVAYRDFNDRFKEFSSDPIKLIDNRKKIDKKNEKNNKAKTQAKGIDRLNNMSTSEIAEGLRNGDIDEEAAEKALEGIDLNSLEDRGEPNAALKLDLAKKINQAYENAVSSIQDLLEGGTIDELIALDALNALELQLATAESVEELLDALGEAFLNPENIDISDLEGMDLDLVEDEIAKRQAAVLNLINNINQDAIEAAEAMADSPTPEDLPIADDIESALDSSTGHDAVDKPKSENHRKEDKQNNPPKKDNKVRTALLLATAVVEYNDIIPEQKGGIINILTKIGEGIDSLFKNGVDEKTMAEAVKSWDSYQMLLSLLGDEETSLLLNHYVKLRRTYGFEDSSQQLEETKSTPQKSEIDAPTPDVTQDDISKLVSLESNRDLSLDDSNSAAPIYNYWKPTITELPIHRERGSNTPYWELAKTMKKEGTNDPLYTDSQLRRMEAVGKYLQRNGAFSRVNSGKVLEKDKIIFITDKTLNEEAGEMVILMAIEDTNGGIHVVGDLPSKDEYITGKQSGLPDYIEACEKVLANSDEDLTIVILPGETTVKQNMVGKVMYTPKNETHTLNEIHGDQEFKLGVAVTGGKLPIIRMKPGGTRVQGLTKEEAGIISPLEGVAGQPFLLMPTSNPRRPYVCVPFFMPKYSELTKDSSLGRAITSILEQISSGSTNADSVRIKNQLGELISVAKNEKGFPEIHINYNGDNVKVTIKPLGSDHLVTLYNGNKNNDKMVENIQSKLYGVPFQVNRKYINKDYKGQSYNRMVGELALTNVAVGETHTRNDWFTINPLGTDLQEKKGSKIKSTKQNPKAVTPASASGATPNSIPVTTKTGNVFYVDPSDWSVYYNGKQFTGNKPGVNKARAIAFGKLNNEDMTKPYDTQWGYYNPVTGNFEQRPDNSQHLEDNIVQFPFDNNLYSVNTNTWLVLDLDNKEYSGPSLNIIRALVYGKIHELLMDKPYETPWGIFNPDTNNFLNDDLFANTPPSKEKELLKNFLIDEAIKFAEEVLLSPMELWAIDNLRLLSFLDVRKDTRIQLLLSQPDIKSRYEAFQKLLRSNRNQKDLDSEGKKEAKPQEATRNTPQLLKDKAKKAGLLNNKNRKALWEVLTTELKLKLVDAFGPKLRQLIQALDLAFDASSNTFNEDALGGSVDLLLNKKALFSKVGSRDFGKKWNQKKELTKMLKMLPQFRKDDLIIILKGLIRIADSQNPGLAYGMFQRGVITISDVAASGTVYHEAFHAVFNSLMSPSEREKIMEAAASLYGNDKTYLVLEENLAEDFRKYVLMREAQEDEMREKYAGRPLLGKIMRFFRKLKHLCGMLRGREPYINKVFKDIYNGRYARRKVLRYSRETRYMNEQYTPEMRDILRKAPRNSEGKLLAPNGKVSKLTERQYAHVRTKAFKEWFGDWINDPENASKVVDENGEPLVVYHFTDDNSFNIYKENKNGLHFTPDETGKDIFYPNPNPYTLNHAVFLNIKNPAYEWSRQYWLNNKDWKKEWKLEKEAYTPGNPNKYKLIKEANNIFRVERILGNEGEGIDAILKVDSTKDGIIRDTGDYVAFNPNQVKSATDNVGTYSRESNDIRYLMVGLKGAKSLDTSEEVTLRIDNLNVAREMEEANKDALTIKAATGWERGADGKWRYEIPDITLKKDSFGGREIDAFYGNDKRSAIKRPIEEVFDLSSLPETYREELEAVGEIKIYSDPSDGERGSYATTDGGVLFSINIGSEDESVESIMAHELLHYILEREGFLEGGDLGIGIDAYLKQNNIYDYYQKLLASKGEYGRVLRNILRNDPLYTKYEDISYNLDRVLDLLPNGAYDDYNIDVDKFIKDLIPDWEKGVSYDTLAEQRKEELIKENKKILDEALDKDDDTERKIEEIRNKLPSSYDAYRRLAGEVESRAAGRRVNLTDLERRNSLFTQEMYKDVAREDLIFLQGQNIGQLNNIRYNRAEVIEELEYDNLELNRLVKEINRLMQIAKDNAKRWHTINKEKWAYISNTGYLTEDAAEDAIPDDMKLVAEVREQYGRYYIKYNTDRAVAKIRALREEIRQNARDIRRLRQLETPFLLDNELSERMLEEQLEREDRQDYLADIAEIRQYHSDKLMYGNLSQEDKDYIIQRKITLEEYNRMSDIEKKTLLECKS